MKKILLLTISIMFFYSCSNNDENLIGTEWRAQQLLISDNTGSKFVKLEELKNYTNVEIGWIIQYIQFIDDKNLLYSFVSFTTKNDDINYFDESNPQVLKDINQKKIIFKTTYILEKGKLTIDSLTYPVFNLKKGSIVSEEGFIVFYKYK